MKEKVMKKNGVWSSEKFVVAALSWRSYIVLKKKIN